MKHPTTLASTGKADTTLAGATTTPGKSEATPGKPEKPYPEFPLFPHAVGQWAKKILGKMHYFGVWADPDAALNLYLAQKDALHAGRRPRANAGQVVTVRDLLNRFVESKELLRDAGEITPRTYNDYYTTCERIGAAFGLSRPLDDLHPEDFEELRAKLSTTWGPVTLGNEIQRIRVVFKYASDNKLVDSSVHYGQGFKRPSRKTLRKARSAKGPRMFQASELRRVHDAAGIQMRAMILLGINCGLGNADCGMLPRSALDLEDGWLNYPRPKTGINRRCPLWPETVAALRAAIAGRPDHKAAADAKLVFMTRTGVSWFKGEKADSPISKEMAKLLQALDLARPGLNFYALRHTFETIGGAARDQVAVDAIMGHARDDMASVYREEVEDARLRAVTDHVRAWLFPPKPNAKARSRKARQRVE